jgi:hypothetical protein
MHMQTTVQNWDKALVKMPDYTLLKAVNDASILIDGRNKWIAAGRDPAKLFLDHRYVTFYYPDFDGADQDKTLDEYKIIWRANFAKTIDATYYTKYAPYIRLVEELNEYTDTRMITDKALLAPRLRSARAAVLVWNAEYRGRNGIPDDARLVVCNSPVGNDIPIEYFQLCRDEDAVLGVRTYTHWVNKVRDPEDFRYHSGRPFFNEQEYGIKVDYVLGETGPRAWKTGGKTWRQQTLTRKGASWGRVPGSLPRLIMIGTTINYGSPSLCHWPRRAPESGSRASHRPILSRHRRTPSRCLMSLSSTCYRKTRRLRRSGRC